MNTEPAPKNAQADHVAIDTLLAMGLEDPERGKENLARITESGVISDLLKTLTQQLSEYLPRSSDPDMALNNLARFVEASRTPLSLGGLFERDPEALKILVQMFSASQHFSDLLISDPESYDLLRITEGQPMERSTLVEEIWADLAPLEHDTQRAGSVLRRFKRRESLRIAYGDLIREQRLEAITEQISYLADAILEGAVRFLRRKHIERWGVPRGPKGEPAEFSILGMGKLGGLELNYSSDIDIICIYDHDGKTDGSQTQTNKEFFNTLAKDLIKLLTSTTKLGCLYRVDLRLRPGGSQAPLVICAETAKQYYDLSGRTWERQAYVKSRPVAGDRELGQQFLHQLTPWIYRRYLSLADITEIKALKRRIEHLTQSKGEESFDVKTGHGGIRDIEFVIQFLQLLNGGDIPSVRTGNTLAAIVQLADKGCLSAQEQAILSENYRFLRKIEHRLQIMFDLQTHQLPRDDRERRKLAIRMGYQRDASEDPQCSFDTEYKKITVENRRVLDHLLHDAFREAAPAEPEVDLVLDPNPPPQKIRLLEKFRFKDPAQAYRNLMELSQESFQFLSTRRCRHFFASIAPRLLKAIARRPDPDSTLLDLCRVSNSLGGKGVLWELFSFNPPTLELYVDLCATSPYLSNILIRNPGMIDELMDSLVLDKLPDQRHLEAMLFELCRGAEEPEPILHSFKNAHILRVGVRDILDKEEIYTTTGTLADIAESCLRQITRIEYPKLVQRVGEPVVALGPRAGHIAEFVILAMGQFGGRELNYQSDLDVVFLYEGEGGTQHRRSDRKHQHVTSNQHFFGELGQRIIKSANQIGAFGRLYEIDPRLRPTGQSGPLATSLEAFSKYFSEEQGHLWERMALCRARVVLGNEILQAQIVDVLRKAVFIKPWSPADADEMVQMRERLEQASHSDNLKRGRGGLVDIEFIVQMLQLRYGASRPSLQQSNTMAALMALREEDLLADEDFQFLTRSYRFLWLLKSRLQLFDFVARDDVPEGDGLVKLAAAMHYAGPTDLLKDFESYRRKNRQLFERFFEQSAVAPS
jgi:glutamate-ammonia-ligase adenylyltransferase